MSHSKLENFLNHLRAFFSPAPGGEPGGEVREAPLLCLVPLCLTALVGLVLFFLAPALEALLLPVVAR